MPVAQAINTDTYLEPEEIQKHLENVEYIIMATPAPSHFKDTPIHFTIFLNTQDEFPQNIKDAILDKFCNENSITNPTEVMSQLMPVGFGKSVQDTPMPILLVKPEDQKSIPYAVMHVIDFLGDSDKFYEAKQEGLTGWSYSYDK
ncbi:MAG: hypothetical protein ABGW74_06475 [Campylobacterales bacterium]|jgi:hypothetical protein